VRYAMARWGYSSHIAGWELSNEIDLVTDYGKQRGHIVTWHNRCAETIRKFDPNPHMITTNFANWKHDDGILKLPVVSYSSTNHYNVQIIDMLRTQIFPIKTAHGKPATMAECGYDFKGAQAETTERYLHICLWGSFMTPFAGAGLSWWWDFIDDRDLYDHFRPLAEFAEGEDRRGRGLEMQRTAPLDPQGQKIGDVIVDALRNDHSGYAWIYERRLLRAESDEVFTPGLREGVVLALDKLRPGPYRVEFWDTHEGGRIAELTAEAKDGTLKCRVPQFTSDIAVKFRSTASPKP